MDYEDVINMTQANFSDTEEMSPEGPNRYFAHEIIFVLCCAVAFFADTAIIYTILYFKKMRTVPNIFIANWAVMDLCSILVTPSGYRIISVIEVLPLSYHFLCILFQLGAALHYMVMICVLVVLIDWCIAAYFTKLSRKIRLYYKFLLGMVWGILLLLFIVYTDLCRNGRQYNFYHAIVTFLTLCIMLLFTLLLHFVKAVQKCRRKPLEYSTLSLNLVTSFMICYAMAFINIILVEFLRLYHPLFAIFSACTVFCNSIITLILLYFYDRNFQVYLTQALRCSSKKYENQITEIDDHHDGFTEVSFHSPSEQLLTSVY